MIFLLSLAVLNLSTTIAQSDSIFQDLKIVNGTNVTAVNEFPFMVNVRYNGSADCGGVLVSHEWVLTAAHCADNYLSVRYGSVFLDEGVFTNVVNVTANYTHPNYRNEQNGTEGFLNLTNDLALLKLEFPLNYSDSVQPASFPSAGSTLKEDNSTTGISIGFGYVDSNQTNPVYLQKVNLTVYSVEYCQARENGSAYFDPNTMFCAGDDEDTKGQCSGDSGSPFLVDNLVWGIVSHTQFPCISSAGVYMNTVPYLDWIRNVTRLTEL